MKTKIILSVVALALIVSAFGQKPTMELTFTAVDNSIYAQLDSIKIMNRTQGVDTVLYYPDTVLLLDYQVGINEVSHEKTDFKVFQNYPNPAIDQTTITLYVPEYGEVDWMITDMLGYQLFYDECMLDKGYHSFRFTPGIGNLFFFTAVWKGYSSSIKVLHTTSNSHQAGLIEYIGKDNSIPKVKMTDVVQSFTFTLGDELLYIGYSNSMQSGMLDFPATSETFIFQFATNIPCPGTPTVAYEGQVYNTIQILSQCWLKENLNVGTMISGNQNMQNNGIKEKYCYNNYVDSCTKYGGLYQWGEMMQYDTAPRVQGICPPGWHIPTDEEWNVLEGSVDSHYGIGDSEWDALYRFRGFDAGKNLKSTSGWGSNSNGTDLFGFSGLPGGYRFQEGWFESIIGAGYWWAAFPTHSSWYNILNGNSSCVWHEGTNKIQGFSVRCLKDS